MKVSIENKIVKIISVQLSDKDIDDFSLCRNDAEYNEQKNHFPVLQKEIKLTSEQLGVFFNVDEVRVLVWWVNNSELSKQESENE